MNGNAQNFWPVASLLINIAIGIVGALLLRWIAGLLQNLKSEIRIAILELEKRIGQEYATKSDLADVRSQVKLAERVDKGFGEVLHILDKPRNSRRRQGAGAEVVR